MTMLVREDGARTPSGSLCNQTTGIESARARLLDMLNASWMTQAASVAVRLRLPELLSHGPLSAATLAEVAECHPPSLLRLLRALTSLELLSESPDETFALTESGTLLRSNVPGSLASWAVLCGTSSWAAWSRLIDSVRTGHSARRLTRGIEGFEHLQDDPEAAAVFNRAMVDLTQPVALAVVRAIDFSGVRTVVDVGGGAGQLLATIVSAHMSIRGVVLDLGHASAMAAELLRAAGVIDRCKLETGSFFDSIPAGADVYLLKSILHDWDDERCATILGNCRAAMARGARLLVIERLMPAYYSASSIDQNIARSDLNMLVGPGGRERGEAEYRKMLDGARFRTIAVQRVSDSYSVLEAAPQ